MPKSIPRKTSRKPAKRPATQSKTARTRKRKPPQKHPPKKKNRFVRTVLWVLVAAGLVASGYFYGIMQRSAPDHERVRKSLAKKVAASHGKITVESAAKTPPKEPSAMDFLQYGQREDALSEAIPDISWYEPGKGEETAVKKQADPLPVPSVVKTAGKPKLVMIIDDVSHPRQLDAIRALPYHITPSIFPPSELSASSHKLARHLKHYMIHLPLESGSKAMNAMQGMLFAHDPKATMQARVDEIRRLFPHARYVNNHTGSVFTANRKAMKQLYGMLRKKGFVFVDSRTTAKSTVRTIARSYGDPYIARDVFIDNTQQVSAILKQLKKAVRIAKKRGYAIAIGHPHKATMKALHQAASILKGVQTVYVDELYR